MPTARAVSLLETLLKRNAAFWLIAGVMLSLLAASLYFAPLRGVFKFASLDGAGLRACAAAVLTALLAFEAIRRVARRRLG